jgi:hypothetical protein
MINAKKNYLPSSFFVRIALLIFIATLFIRPVYYYITEGFALNRIEVIIPPDPKLLLPSPTEKELKKLKIITSQPFHYLKKGSQAYAFISKDGMYILKLFKFHHMRELSWVHAIPLPQTIAQKRDFLLQRRAVRTNLSLNSYKIAQTSLKDECGLIFTQILPSSSYNLPVSLEDRVGREYTIDLSHYGFAIQHRLNLVLPSLRTWISENKIDEAKKALSSLVGLIVTRSKKGIQDSDPDLHKNAGLIGTTGVHIDIGSFSANPNISQIEKMRPDVQKTFRKLVLWLQDKSPELSLYLSELLKDPEEASWTAPSYSDK